MHPTTSLSILWLLNTCVCVFYLQLRTCSSTWTPSSPITSPSPTPWSWSSFWLVRSRKCRELINQSNRSMCWSIFIYSHFKNPFLCPEEEFLLSQAALLVQVSSLQPLLDSTYIRGDSCNHTFLFFFLFLFLFCTDLLCQRLWVSGARDHVFPQHMLSSTDVPEHATKLQRLSQIHIREQVRYKMHLVVVIRLSSLLFINFWLHVGLFSGPNGDSVAGSEESLWGIQQNGILIYFCHIILKKKNVLGFLMLRFFFLMTNKLI